jgi:uncharacterized protein Yka (UPF0111/DUF47 family)
VTRWFLPHDPDLLARLREQASLAVEAAAALEYWASGDDDAGERVREIEHEADQAKRELFRDLRVTFSPPIDGEDLFVLAQGLENLINQMKNVVRESEVLELAPDDGVRDMARVLREGVKDLGRAIDHITVDDTLATDAADTVIKCDHAIEHIYRRAMSESLIEGDLREVMGKRELYRRLSRLGEALSAVAERVWYAVVKEG